jgi:hypothetical protein
MMYYIAIVLNILVLISFAVLLFFAFRRRQNSAATPSDRISGMQAYQITLDDDNNASNARSYRPPLFGDIGDFVVFDQADFEKQNSIEVYDLVDAYTGPDNGMNVPNLTP